MSGLPPSQNMHVFTYTSNGTYVVPSSVNAIFVNVAQFGGGGGAGGQNVATTSGGGGGGSGMTILNYWLPVTPGSTLTLTVGLGGAGGTANNYGAVGGNTYISGGLLPFTSNPGGGGPFYAGAGGSGGSPGIANVGGTGGGGGGQGGASGSNTGFGYASIFQSTMPVCVGAGGAGGGNTTVAGNTGGSSWLFFGGIGGVGNCAGGGGAASYLGPGAAGGANNVAGVNATAYGAGGGGGGSFQSGGKGGNGFIMLTAWY